MLYICRPVETLSFFCQPHWNYVHRFSAHFYKYFLLSLRSVDIAKFGSVQSLSQRNFSQVSSIKHWRVRIFVKVLARSPLQESCMRRNKVEDGTISIENSPQGRHCPRLFVPLLPSESSGPIVIFSFSMRPKDFTPRLTNNLFVTKYICKGLK